MDVEIPRRQGFCGGGNVHVVNRCERQDENLQAGVDRFFMCHLKRIENELRQGNVNPDDPMAEKGKLYKSFKNDLKLFMRAVVRETIDSRDLFDDTMFEMFGNFSGVFELGAQW